MLGNFCQVRRFVELLAWRTFHGLEQAIFVQRVAGVRAKFFVGARRVMAGQAVDVALVAKVEIFVFPAVAGVATGTARLVGGDRATKIVGHMLLAQFFTGGWAIGFPSPVDALHHLMARCVMAGKAGLGHFWAGFEGAAQGFQLAVVRC